MGDTDCPKASGNDSPALFCSRLNESEDQKHLTLLVPEENNTSPIPSFLDPDSKFHLLYGATTSVGIDIFKPTDIQGDSFKANTLRFTAGGLLGLKYQFFSFLLNPSYERFGGWENSNSGNSSSVIGRSGLFLPALLMFDVYSNEIGSTNILVGYAFSHGNFDTNGNNGLYPTTQQSLVRLLNYEEHDAAIGFGWNFKSKYIDILIRGSINLGAILTHSRVEKGPNRDPDESKFNFMAAINVDLLPHPAPASNEVKLEEKPTPRIVIQDKPPIVWRNPESESHQGTRAMNPSIATTLKSVPHKKNPVKQVKPPIKKPVPLPPKDTDGDGIPDNKDKCPRVKGSARGPGGETKGPVDNGIQTWYGPGCRILSK